MVQMTVCTIVLTAKEAETIDQVTTAMKAAGISIDRVDTENGVIECTGPESVIANWEKHHLVESVRRELSFVKGE